MGKDIRICKYAVNSSEIFVNKGCPTSQSLKEIKFKTTNTYLKARNRLYVAYKKLK